jgi:hypothetical protein
MATPKRKAPGLVAAEWWRLIAVLQMLTGGGRPIPQREIARWTHSGRYLRMLAGLREAGYLRRRGWLLTKNGQATAAWPQKVVPARGASAGYGEERVPAEKDPKRRQAPNAPIPGSSRKRYSPAQQHALRGLQGVREYLQPYHGKRVDLSTESPNGGPYPAEMDRDEITEFLSALHRQAWWMKAALREGLEDHPRVAPWVGIQRRLRSSRRWRTTLNRPNSMVTGPSGGAPTVQIVAPRFQRSEARSLLAAMRSAVPNPSVKRW